MNDLPRWAVEMRDLFRSGSTAQFLIHGNVFDVIPHGGRLLSLPAFLDEVMFGTAKGIDQDGALLLEDDHCELQRVIAGDVIPV